MNKTLPDLRRTGASPIVFVGTSLVLALCCWIELSTRLAQMVFSGTVLTLAALLGVLALKRLTGIPRFTTTMLVALAGVGSVGSVAGLSI